MGAAGFFGGMFFVLFFSFLFWFKFFGGGLETNFLFGALTKIMLRLFFAFLVAAVDLWVGVAFSFLVGDFLSFLVADFLCITLFYGFYNLIYRFLSFFTLFFVLPVNLFF